MSWPLRSLALAALLAACAGSQETPLVGSPAAPAAEGFVTAAPAENGNTRLTVRVKHLAFPERISPGAKVYVVWVQSGGGPPQNVGALTVNQDLSGRLETVTPLVAFQVFVSAEPFPTTTVPQGPRILTGTVGQ